MLLPSELVKLIKSYLIGKYTLLINKLIPLINNFYDVNLNANNIDLAKNEFDNFNTFNSANIKVNIVKSGRRSFVQLEIINMDNINYHFIKNLISTNLNFLIKTEIISNKDFVDHIMCINRILIDCHFGNFLVLSYITNLGSNISTLWSKML